MLQRRARVVDLVEIRAVVPGGALRDGHRLVREGGVALRDRNIRRVDAQTVLREEGHLADLHVLLAVAVGVEDHAVGDEAGLFELGVAPLEHVAVFLRQLAGVDLGAVFEDVDFALAGVQPGEVEDPADVFRLGERDLHAPARGHRAEGLRRGAVAEIREGDDGVDDRERRDAGDARLRAFFDGRRDRRLLQPALAGVGLHVLPVQSHQEKHGHEHGRQHGKQISPGIQ